VLRKDRQEPITNNTLATFDNAVKYNNRKLHNNKAPGDLSTPQKKERAVAKRRKKMLKKIEGDEAKVEVIQEIVGSIDKPISQAKLDITEEVVLQRIERAQAESDSDED
jgi:dGTP triphosphohydrolase